VQPSQIGSACLSRTADTGPGVGLVKESVPGTMVAVPGSSISLVQELQRDQLVVRHEKVFPRDIYEKRMTMIFVNGIWVGCTLRPRELRIKYIELRRGFNLDGSKAQFFDRSFNIEFEHTIGEIHFWTDFGRIQCPRIIVRCNDPYIDPVGAAMFKKLGYPEFDPTKPPIGLHAEKNKSDNFIQDMMVTREDIEAVFAGKKTTDDLHREGKIDYINPNELQNCYIAQDLDDLRANARNTLKAFTHVEIPSVAFGLMALTCPFIASDQAARTSMQTNQGKQAVSINTANHINQFEKRAMGGDVDVPLVVTVANVLSPVSNTRNAIFMTGTFRGFNQEDSLVSNITASQRGMFSAIFMNTLKDKIEGATVGIAPGEHGKRSAKRHDYSKLDDKGLVRVGAKIKQGDVLVAKYVTETSGVSDTSLTHKGEPAQVIGVFDGFNKEGDRIIKIKIVIYRPMTYGDKFSSRHGQKGMNAQSYLDTELPHVDGISPTFIMSPFAYPTRMTIGQEKETLASTVCAELGCHFNASAMTKYDDSAMMEKAESLGLSAYADRTIYNGLNGRPHKGFTCGIVAYQRLMKWAADEHYAISHGNTDPVTKQAVEGKVKGGGFRLGEMEKDVFFANGNVFTILEKFDIDSDGKEGYVCRNCGNIPVVNLAKSTVKCKKCDSEAVIPDIVKTRFSWTSALLLGIINTMGIGVGLSITPNVYVEK
jgi:DNA-directed RNA polymerase beta subunit